MKKLMFLLVAGTMFVFTACNCGSCTDDCTEKCCAKDGAECADDCQKACCLGCQATEGDKNCIILEDGSMPCCPKIKKEIPHDESVPHTH